MFHPVEGTMKIHNHEQYHHVFDNYLHENHHIHLGIALEQIKDNSRFHMFQNTSYKSFHYFVDDLGKSAYQ